MPTIGSVTFYIGAHQDDWQLFMSPQAYNDLVSSDTRVIFIYTTAGDAGGDMAWRHGRTTGALSSIQFATHQRIAAVTPELVEINGHPIACYTIATTRSYCLDLPDGNADGNGFPITGHHSLQKLQEGTIGGAAALVGEDAYRTTYASWADLVATIRAIIERETGSDEAPWVHIIDPSVTQHSDHRCTSLAVQEGLAGDTRYQIAMYEEYRTPAMEANVSGIDLVLKSGLYLFYAQTAFEASGRLDHLDEWHLSFIPRQYRTN